MPRFTLAALTLTVALTPAFAQQTSTPTPNPYPTDPASGSTKSTPDAEAATPKAQTVPPTSAIKMLHDQSQNKAIRISPKVEAGMILSKTPPTYPPMAAAAHIGGTVVLETVIGKDGIVKKITILSGPNLLISAAVDAVKTWRYRPYLLNGEPTEVLATVNVNFNLVGAPGKNTNDPSGGMGSHPPTVSGMPPH